MSRIQRVFQELKQTGKKGLIPFITAGDPDVNQTVARMHGLVEAGANVIELGVPFSDPMADGPVIQRASERALAKGVRYELPQKVLRQRGVSQVQFVLHTFLPAIHIFSKNT